MELMFWWFIHWLNRLLYKKKKQNCRQLYRLAICQWPGTFWTTSACQTKVNNCIAASASIQRQQQENKKMRNRLNDGWLWGENRTNCTTELTGGRIQCKQSQISHCILPLSSPYATKKRLEYATLEYVSKCSLCNKAYIYEHLHRPNEQTDTYCFVCSRNADCLLMTSWQSKLRVHVSTLINHHQQSQKIEKFS